MYPRRRSCSRHDIDHFEYLYDMHKLLQYFNDQRRLESRSCYCHALVDNDNANASIGDFLGCDDRFDG